MQDNTNREEIEAIIKGAMENQSSPLNEGSEFGAAGTPKQTEPEATNTMGESDNADPAITLAGASNTYTNGEPVDMGKIEFLLDVPLDVSVELGRAKMPIKDMIQLGPGSVIELDKLIGEPVDFLVNNRTIARGEVVVFDENFGIRITDILKPEDRIKMLR